MKFEYLFDDTKNIFTGLRVDGSYLTFWTNFKERMINYIDIELLLFRKIFPKGYTFIGVYNDQSEHDENYSKLHSDLSENNPFNWLSNNNIGPHYHFKCTRNGEACEITPHLLKQLLIIIASFQNNIKERKQFQKFVQEKMPHVPSANIQTEKLYFPGEEIDTIYKKSMTSFQLANIQQIPEFFDLSRQNHASASINANELFLPIANNATIKLALFSLMSVLVLYLLCFRSRKNKAEKNGRVMAKSRHFTTDFTDESTNLSVGNGNVSALVAMSVLSGSKQSKHFSREMRSQVNRLTKRF